MSSSVSFAVGLLCLTILLSFPEPGTPQCYKPGMRSYGHLRPTCCSAASLAPIREPIVSCFEQHKNTFPNCNIDAFLFIGVNNTRYCVKPSATWLKTRFQKLEKRGICCNIL